MTRFLFLTASEQDASREQNWSPPVDVYHTPGGWLLKYELAGVRLEDLKLHVGRQNVTLSGVRRDWMLEEGCSYYSMEISYNRFERVVDLPSNLEGARIQLDYRDGILLARITLDPNRQQNLENR